ncbi:MAG: branched-chain amino acid ABC transporter permease [Chloroflexi bacterium]|nr:branched-chain amino acid ABC transporter permease [Chloroflexota bacterium]
MIERYLFSQTQKIQNQALREVVELLLRTVLANWFFAVVLIVLWRFPYLVADQTDGVVTPELARMGSKSFTWQLYMASALVMASLAMSYNLLFGFSGIISFGHGLFFGAGGYITYLVIAEYNAEGHNTGLTVALALNGALLLLMLLARARLRWPMLLIPAVSFALVFVLVPKGDTITFYRAMGVAVVGSVVLSVLSAIVMLRLKGVYFAMFTLALAEVSLVLSKSFDVTGRETGVSLRTIIPEELEIIRIPANRLDVYYITLAFFVVVFLAIRRYMNSPVGRAVLAIRENEERASTIGYNVFYYRMMTLVFAGIIATLSGVLFVLVSADRKIRPEYLGINYTVLPLLHTLTGGMGTFSGPALAALGLELSESYLREEAVTFRLFKIITVWQLVVGMYAVFAMMYVRFAWEKIILPLIPPRVRERILARVAHLPVTIPEAWSSYWRRYRLGTTVVMGILPFMVGVLYANEIKHDYLVNEIWPLLLGALFIIAVMALPNGIVGTWIKWRAERQIRRLQREMQQAQE